MDTKLMTIQEVADFTQLSVSHLYSLVSKGEIPHFKLGSATRFAESDILNWLRSKRVYTKYDCATKANNRRVVLNL
jgi:excisionase family DNA binding protein